MRGLRLIGISLLLLLVGISSAQEDLGWLTGLLPTGEDINIEKQVLQGSIEIAAGGQVLSEGFNAVNAWETEQGSDRFLRIRESQYEILIRSNGIIYSGLGSQSYDDVILSVNTQHLSEELNDGYGLVCRAEDRDNGYHFYISGDGYFRIFRWEDGRATGLTDWTSSAAVVQGVGAINSLTAVCVNDYLALYINASLAAEVRDDAFDSGRVGMSLILFTENSETHIAFDDLRVWDASSDAPRASNTTSNPTPAPAVVTGIGLDASEQTASVLRRIENSTEALLLGELRYSDDFESDSNWDTIETAESRLRVRNGVLQAFTESNSADTAVIFTEESYTNNVIQVDTSFIEGTENNAISLVCRGSEEASLRGYYFNISSDGFYSIWVNDGESFRFLREWDRSLAIEQASENRLTVVCLNDYFAFYVNDTLLHEFYDSLYTSGTVGMTIFSFEGESEITFDNLFIWDVSLED